MHRIVASMILFSAVFSAISPQTASAQPITVPSGLSPGDQYRLAFVTSTTTDASSSDIAYYNTFVNTAANSIPALTGLGPWTAIASTATVDALDNTSTDPSISAGVPIYNLNDTIIANSNIDLWGGNVFASIAIPPLGLFADAFVWTGTTSLGFTRLTGGLGDPSGVAAQGNYIFTDSGWIAAGRELTTVMLPLYALSLIHI